MRVEKSKKKKKRIQAICFECRQAKEQPGRVMDERKRGEYSSAEQL